MLPPRVLLYGLLLAGLLAAPVPGHATLATGLHRHLNPGHQPTRIVGGTAAQDCQWGSTAQLNIVSGNDSFVCSGTLVDPNILIYAAHCGDGVQTINFGNNADAPGMSITPKSCHLYPGHLTQNGTDFAYCQIAPDDRAKLLKVPIVPILMGCETAALRPGKIATLVGYGRDEGNGINIKRFVTAPIKARSNNRVLLGGSGKDTCNGDSGGPAFIQLQDSDQLPGRVDSSWRVFGITSTAAAAGCGGGGYDGMMHLAVPWIEADSGIDITPCHDADGSWHPDARCTDFPLDPGDPQDCSNANASGQSGTCGDSFLAPGFGLNLDLPPSGSNLDLDQALVLGLSCSGAAPKDLDLHVTFNGGLLSPMTPRRLGAATSDDPKVYFGPITALTPGHHSLVVSGRNAAGAVHSIAVDLSFDDLPGSTAVGCSAAPTGTGALLGCLGLWRRRRRARPLGLALLALSSLACDTSGHYIRLDLLAPPDPRTVQGGIKQLAAPFVDNRLGGSVSGATPGVQEALFTFGQDKNGAFMLVLLTDGTGYCADLQANQDRASLNYVSIQLMDADRPKDGPLAGSFTVMAPPARPQSGRFAYVQVVRNDASCSNRLSKTDAFAQAGTISLSTRISVAGGYVMGDLTGLRIGSKQEYLSGSFTALGCPQPEPANTNDFSCQ